MSMMMALALLLLQTAASPPDKVRSITVAFTDEKGALVEGLVPEEVAVMENGVARELTRLEPDRRPLTVAILVDSSEAVSTSFRLNVVEAVIAFLRRLPEGSRYALWTTGDRPTKIVDYTADVSEASRALKRVFPQGGSTLLDALVEASQDLRKREGERMAVVAVTGVGIEFSNRDRHRVVEEAQGSATVFSAVQFEEGAAPLENRRDYEFVLSTLTSRTGGLYETPLSAMGVETALQKIANDLRSQYRLSYASLSGPGDRNVEVRVARPGVKARVGAAGPEATDRRVKKPSKR